MIFITGHHNTGKSTIAKWLKSLGFAHIETGDIVRKNHLETNPEENFYDWIEKKNMEDKTYLDDLIVNQAKSVLRADPLARLVITGNRQLDGINYLKQKIDLGMKPLILFLQAPEEELYRRQLERSDRIVPGLTFDVFKNEYLAYDEAMGLDFIREQADHVLDNPRDDDRVRDKIKEILRTNSYLD